MLFSVLGMNHRLRLSLDQNLQFLFYICMLLCCLQVRLAECGDSTKTQHKDAVDEGTPCSKVVGKRTVDSVGSATKDVLELGENSITKPAKLTCKLGKNVRIPFFAPPMSFAVEGIDIRTREFV
jgi:hypothetical protein